MEIIEKRTDELIPYVNNPRLNDDAVDVVASSIKEFGFKVPMVVTSDNVVVTGHTRLKAAKKIGMDKVPCVVADDLSEAQIKAFRLADNKVAEIAEWDLEKLNIELEGLLDDIDMTDFGFEDPTKPEPDIEDIIEDEPPEPPEEPKSKLGDIYQLGNHRVMCGDATDADAVKTLMGGVLADLVLTDPPYNVAIGDKNKALNEANGSNSIEDNLIGDKGMTDEECGEMLWRPAFKNAFENANDKCAVYSFMPQGGTHMMMMMMMIGEAGWQVKHELIWVKNAAVFSMGRLDYDYKHEPIFYGWKYGHNFYATETMNSIFEDQDMEFSKMKKEKLIEILETVFSEGRPVSVIRENKTLHNDLHPTMKPIKLLARLIMNSSKESETILDIFGGSGSTLIAAEQLNRKCYMMELDPHYVDVIIERWENFTGQKAEKIQSKE